MKTQPPDSQEWRRQFVAGLRSDWRSIAREEQVAPAGDWTTWIFCAGRGAGKTRSGAEWVQERVETGVARRIHLIAPTAADCRDVLLEGPAGILSIARADMRPIYSSSLRKVEWPNGAIALLFSSDEPDRLRGPQADTLWIDELCAMRSAQEVLDMASMGLRLGKDPRCLITTTPRPIKPFKALIARAGQDVVVTRCSTMANAENLARPFLSQILQQYQGTRLGRQELNAELLLDVPGAMWTLQMIEETRVNVAPAQFQRVVVGVDPAGSTSEWADHTGIVVAALAHDSHLYILEDASGSYTPSQWAQVCVDLYHRYRADRICVERNYGGDMVEATIRSADPSVAIKAVTSSRGKVLRAEPVSALWEQKRAHVVGSMPALEDQACNFTHTWDRARDGSPDRLDAMIFAATELMCNQQASGYFNVGPLLSGGQPVDIPKRVHALYAVAVTGTKNAETLGVIYVASTLPGLSYDIAILDWDIWPVDAELYEVHQPHIFERLKALATETDALAGERSIVGLLGQGSQGVPAAMLAQGLASGRAVVDIDTVASYPPAFADRAAAAARFLHPGKQVKITRSAHDKLVTLRSVTKNHFLSQLNAYQIGQDMEADELLGALFLAVLVGIDDPKSAAP